MERDDVVMPSKGSFRSGSAAVWTISVVLSVSGCASQMPSVSGFMSPKQLWNDFSVTTMAGGRTFFVDNWTYGCKPFPDTTGPRAGLLTCSESDAGLYRYSELPYRLGYSVYLGDSWRIGVDGGSLSASAGWRNRNWGLMAWVNPSPRHGAGLACAQQWNPTEWLRLGIFEYGSIHPYDQWHRDDSTIPNIIRDSKELGAGSWIRVGEGHGASLETKIGKEIGRDRFRYYAAFSAGFGSDFEELSLHQLVLHFRKKGLKGFFEPF